MLHKRLRDRLRLLLRPGLDHHADERLRAGRADQHAAVFPKFSLCRDESLREGNPTA